MENIFLYLAPFFVVGGWYFVATVLRNMARMTKRLDVETGSAIRSSGWGSASINGIGAQNCVKIDEHDEGLLVRMMWIFGGGKLWLPKSLVKVGELKKGTFFFPRSRVLICEMNQVILYSRLADFVENLSSEKNEPVGED